MDYFPAGPAAFQSCRLPFRSPPSCSTPASLLWGQMWFVAAGISGVLGKPHWRSQKNTLANVEYFHSSRRNPLCCSKTLRVVYCRYDDVVAERASADVLKVMSWLSLGTDRSKEERGLSPAGVEQKILTKNKTSKMMSMEYEIIHEGVLEKRNF